MTLSPGTVTRLEKAAADNGFDLERPASGEWLPFGSSHAPLEIWLGADRTGRPIAALSRLDVAAALRDQGEPITHPLPAGAQAAIAVPDVPALDQLLRRAYQLARSLPDEILHAFEERVAGLPRTTEAERLVVQRVGQDLFRERLLEYWEGRCAVTELAVPELLRASHIKPWADCETDAERLDVFNGLLLAAHLDAAFDAGLVTVTADGAIRVSPHLSPDALGLLGLDRPVAVRRLEPRHQSYLTWHRSHVFRS